MWGTFYDFFLGGATPEERTRAWRLIITIVFLVHFAYSYGWFPSITAGFATVESVAQLQNTIDSIQVKQLLNSIETERRNACRNLAEDNRSALRYSVRKRDELISEYKQVTGQDVPQVTCLELGISITEEDN